MLSSPACGLKHYIPPAAPATPFQWVDIAQVVLDAYIGQQKIEREDLEVFKCVQVQYETQGPQETPKSLKSLRAYLCRSLGFVDCGKTYARKHNLK